MPSYLDLTLESQVKRQPADHKLRQGEMEGLTLRLVVSQNSPRSRARSTDIQRTSPFRVSDSLADQGRVRLGLLERVDDVDRCVDFDGLAVEQSRIVTPLADGFDSRAGEVGIDLAVHHTQ